jgi:DtxR family transcriptional regulator, Mn-dependent transcriptional regulator
MDQMNLSAPAEDCLLLLHRMGERLEPGSTSGLARALGVADSTVTAMLQRLSKRKLINYRARKEISLTAAGLEITTRLIRRHRLIETYLFKKLNYSWDEIHAEAERLEHVVSDRFIEAISSELGNPTVDPHGDPIPDISGAEVKRDLTNLAQMVRGQRGKIARVLNATPERLAYLTRLGLELGVEIDVMDAPGQDSIIHLRLGKREMAVGKEIAAQILLEIVV